MIIVEGWLQRWLLGQPEYGMGYQKATVTLSTGGIEKGIIVNAQIFLKENDTQWEIYLSDWNEVLKEAHKSAMTVKNADLIKRPPETLRGVRAVAISANSIRSFSAESLASLSKSSGTPAKDAPITMTSAGEIFKRFSAYAKDNRITEKQGLRPATFATTKEDADANIKTGADAVSRYALENKKSASNVFTIKPPGDTSLQRGIVEPAYGEIGGGVEVIFVNGSPDNTVTGPEKIPDN